MAGCAVSSAQCQSRKEHQGSALPSNLYFRIEVKLKRNQKNGEWITLRLRLNQMYLLGILHSFWCRRLPIPLSSVFPVSSTDVSRFMRWQRMRHACSMCTMPNPPTPSWSSLWHPLCQVPWLNIQHSRLSIHIRKLNSPTSPWERKVVL